MEYLTTGSGDIFELALKGKFTFSDNKVYSGFLQEIENSQYKKVVVDLKSVEFIDSAALGLLLLTRDKCDRAGISLVLRNPQGQVKQMFDISRFGDLFTIQAA